MLRKTSFNKKRPTLLQEPTTSQIERVWDLLEAPKYQLVMNNIYYWGFQGGNDGDGDYRRQYGESDRLGVFGPGYLHDFEIKMSESDLIADFERKRLRHRILSNGSSGGANCFSITTGPELALKIEKKYLREYMGLQMVEIIGMKTRVRTIVPAPQLHNHKWLNTDSDEFKIAKWLANK